MPKNLVLALVIGATALAAASIGEVAGVLAPRTAQALPIYAQRTGLPCGQCHVNPQGGGPRTAFGQAFAANGHHLPSKTHGHRSNSGSGMMGGHRSGMMGGGMMGH